MPDDDPSGGHDGQRFLGVVLHALVTVTGIDEAEVDVADVRHPRATVLSINLTRSAAGNNGLARGPWSSTSVEPFTRAPGGRSNVVIRASGAAFAHRCHVDAPSHVPNSST